MSVLLEASLGHSYSSGKGMSRIGIYQNIFLELRYVEAEKSL